MEHTDLRLTLFLPMHSERRLLRAQARVVIAYSAEGQFLLLLFTTFDILRGRHLLAQTLDSVFLFLNGNKVLCIYLSSIVYVIMSCGIRCILLRARGRKQALGFFVQFSVSVSISNSKTPGRWHYWEHSKEHAHVHCARKVQRNFDYCGDTSRKQNVLEIKCNEQLLRTAFMAIVIVKQQTHSASTYIIRNVVQCM